MTRIPVKINRLWKHIFAFLVVIYRLTASTDSSLSMAEIRCLSDHQDQIRSLINVNGQFVTAVNGTEGALCFNVYLYISYLPQMGSLPVAPMQASWSCGMRLTGTSWPMSTFCGRSPNPAHVLKYNWTLPNRVRCPFSIWALMERQVRRNEWIIFVQCDVWFSRMKPTCVFFVVHPCSCGQWPVCVQRSDQDSGGLQEGGPRL